jgi:hypothetical protein
LESKNLLTKLEENWLQLFCIVKKNQGTILKRAFKLKW